MGKGDTGQRNALTPRQREKGCTPPREKEKGTSREEKGNERENVGTVEKQGTGHMSARIHQRREKEKGMGKKAGNRGGSQMACARYVA